MFQLTGGRFHHLIKMVNAVKAPGLSARVRLCSVAGAAAGGPGEPEGVERPQLQ